MNWKRGIAVAVLQLLLVSSLAAKLLYDRATRPRVWVKTLSYDPDLPVRGRYASLGLVVYAPWLPLNSQGGNGYTSNQSARLQSCEQGLCAIADPDGTVNVSLWPWIWDGMSQEAKQRALANRNTIISEPVPFFIGEHVQDPTWRRDGSELWAEVTIPKSGPPRPLRLGTKKGGGAISPIELR